MRHHESEGALRITEWRHDNAPSRQFVRDKSFAVDRLEHRCSLQVGIVFFEFGETLGRAREAYHIDPNRWPLCRYPISAAIGFRSGFRRERLVGRVRQSG